MIEFLFMKILIELVYQLSLFNFIFKNINFEMDRHCCCLEIPSQETIKATAVVRGKTCFTLQNDVADRRCVKKEKQ